MNRWGEANLDWLIQTGKGDQSVTEAQFKCRFTSAIPGAPKKTPLSGGVS